MEILRGSSVESNKTKDRGEMGITAFNLTNNNGSNLDIANASQQEIGKKVSM